MAKKKKVTPPVQKPKPVAKPQEDESGGYYDGNGTWHPGHPPQ